MGPVSRFFRVEKALMRKKLMPAIAALSALLVPLQSFATCKEKIAEVDERIADPELDTNLRNAVKQFRDNAVSMCDQGNDATAMQVLGYVEMMLPPPRAEVEAAKQADTASKAHLTNEYLEGVWCSMTGEERSQLVFAADGSSRACFSDSMLGAYGKCVDYEPAAEWIGGFDRVEGAEQDRIVFVGNGGQSVYMRGECKLHGR